MANVRDIHPGSTATGCTGCHVRHLCLPAKLEADEISRFNGALRRRGPFNRGDVVYSPGEPLAALYIVQVGSLKSVGVTGHGAEYITRFHLPGDLVGADAIDAAVHHWSAIALERTWLCAVPFEQIEALAREIPALGRALTRALSCELMSDEGALMTLGKLSAEQRVIWFLNELHDRLQARLGPSDQIQLPMSRADIASYLGMTTETVCRLLAQLQMEGVIQFNNRSVRIQRRRNQARRCR
ncbi:MAG TPA: helix-turn-helix domain-containing protein [Gammaproteobacteria bacterium]|nr:helix-turn-helix domain-containing protein [Gammaproteobacteria bacterium]